MRKKMPYWLTAGGLIGLAVFILIDILLPLICSLGYIPFFDNIDQDCYILIFPLLAFPLLMQSIFGVETIDIRFALISNIIIFAAVGAIIGWIVGKIKHK